MFWVAQDIASAGRAPSDLPSSPWAHGLLERVGEARKALRTSLGRASLGELSTPRIDNPRLKVRPPSILVSS